MDVRTKVITHADSTTTKLQIWDTPGSDAHYKLARSTVVSTDAILLVFALDDRPSWRRIRHWIETVSSFNEEPCPIILCGNKLDCRRSDETNTEKIVRDSEIEKTAAELGCHFVLTSARSGEGVDEVFQQLAERARDGMIRSGKSSGGTPRGGDSGRVGKIGSEPGKDGATGAPTGRKCC